MTATCFEGEQEGRRRLSQPRPSPFSLSGTKPHGLPAPEQKRGVLAGRMPRARGEMQLVPAPATTDTKTRKKREGRVKVCQPITCTQGRSNTPVLGQLTPGTRQWL